MYAAVAAVPGDNYIRYLERKRGHALNMLSLSGGGQNGAFGAGFLIGWRESGRRPQFDLVGGVSTGALLATNAFSAPLPTMRRWKRCTRKSPETISLQNRGIFSLCPLTHYRTPHPCVQ
jgi:predicted acylesterase/phospholipase RssA